MAKKHLTPAMVAALASGVALESAAATDAAALAATEAAAVETAATEAAAADAAAATQATADAAAATQAAADAATQAAAVVLPAADTALVTHLQTELATLRTAQSASTLQVAQLTQQVASLQADNTQLNAVALEAATRLCVALNSSPALIETLTGSNLCAAYARLNTDFTSKFKVGAQSVVESDVVDPTVAAQAAADPMHNARVKATRK